jgi:hypothetical protein
MKFWRYMPRFTVGLLKIAVELFDVEHRQNHDFDIVRARSIASPEYTSDGRRERHEDMLDSMRTRQKIKILRNKNIRCMQCLEETTVHIGRM